MTLAAKIARPFWWLVGWATRREEREQDLVLELRATVGRLKKDLASAESSSRQLQAALYRVDVATDPYRHAASAFMTQRQYDALLSEQRAAMMNSQSGRNLGAHLGGVGSLLGGWGP